MRARGNDDFAGGALGLIRHGWRVVLLLAVLGIAAGLTYSFLSEKEYRAETSLLFRDPGFDQKLFGAPFASSQSDPVREAATNVRLVSLDVVASRAAKELGQGYTTARIRGIVS